MIYQLVARNKRDLYDKELMIDVIGEERSIWNLAFYLYGLMDKQLEIKVYDLEFHDLQNYKGGYPFQSFKSKEEIEKFYGIK